MVRGTLALKELLKLGYPNLFSMRAFYLNLLLMFAALHFAAVPALAQPGDAGQQGAARQAGDAGQQLIKKKCGVAFVVLSPDKNPPPYPPLFNSIRVVDLRRDTSRAGLVSNGRNAQDEVRFPSPAADQLKRYLDAGYASPKGGQSLLVVIKDLWIADPKSIHYLTRPAWNVNFLLEAYLDEKDGYKPLAYMDTTLHELKGSSLQDAVAWGLPELMDIFMDKVAAYDQAGGWEEKRTVSYEQIDSFNRARFDYAMDTVTRPIKGVYRNVEEFKNNAPSISQYELSKDKSGNLEVRVRDENGQLYFTRTVWGCCDGQQVYMMMDGNLFPVFDVQHQFYVLGSKDYRDRKTRVPYVIPLGPMGMIVGTTKVGDNVVRDLHLYRLNVKTGRVTE
jgi:hypothetical protein